MYVQSRLGAQQICPSTNTVIDNSNTDPSKGTSAARSLLSSTKGALISHTMTLSLSTPDANKGNKDSAPWIYFNVKFNKTVEIFSNPGTRPALPEHESANSTYAPRSLQSQEQALSDLKDVWGQNGPAINPKGAVDCWMALFRPESDAIVPERTEAVVEEPTVMLSTLPLAYDPLPGKLPLHTTEKPDEYYLDLPRVSGVVQAAT